MEYFVSQIKHKLKIFGPFGFKEFIILVICFGISLILYYTIAFVFFILVSVLIFAIAFAFIFIKVNGAPLEEYLKAFSSFIFLQKSYFWRRDITEVRSVKVISKQKQKEKEGLYQVVKDGALVALSNQINLGIEVEEISRKTERVWKQLLELD